MFKHFNGFFQGNSRFYHCPVEDNNIDDLKIIIDVHDFDESFHDRYFSTLKTMNELNNNQLDNLPAHFALHPFIFFSFLGPVHPGISSKALVFKRACPCSITSGDKSEDFYSTFAFISFFLASSVLGILISKMPSLNFVLI